MLDADDFRSDLVIEIDLGGQADALAVSPDKKYIAVAIENERDEDLGDRFPLQITAGFLAVVDSSDAGPKEWLVEYRSETHRVGWILVPD